MNIPSIKTYLLSLQNAITAMLQNEDATLQMREDRWEHKTGGGGITRAFTGDSIEKAGVNFSHIMGDQLPLPALAKHRAELAGGKFQALGVSVVVHPRNPYAPTAHLNVRFFGAEKPDGEMVWWFGGGFDLTPYYGFTEDCVHWHETAKNACEPFGKEIYPKYKKCCDDYFYLPHRKEPRGIGGLFFDDLNEWKFEKCFEFMRAVGDSFSLGYQPIISKRKNMAFTEREKNFQKYRRGRYVEFNLVYDRGTLFGLQSGGRTESILVSMPPEVIWQYDYHPEAGSKEVELYEKFLVRKEWV